MLPEEIQQSLKNLEIFLSKKPTTIHKALTYESEKQFVLYAIQLAKAKLISDPTNEYINRINLLKGIDKKIEHYKEYKDNECDKVFLNEMYKEK